MFRRAAAVVAVLAVGASGIAGCKDRASRESAAQKSAVAPVATSPKAAAETGEQLFKQYCAACHPDGGNVVTPQKTLHAAVLADNSIRKPEEIVALMRNPGPGMRKFDAATIPDQQARLIAGYVLAAFR